MKVQSWTYVDTPEKYREMMRFMTSSRDEKEWDTETNGTDWRVHQICGFGWGMHDREFYVPIRHAVGFNFDPKVLSEDIFPALGGGVQVLHHASFDFKMAYKDGFELPKHGELWDTILAALLCNENEYSFKMEDLTEKYIAPGMGNPEEKLIDIIVGRFGGSRKDAKGKLWKLEGGEVAEYACQDIRSTRAFKQFYAKELDRQEMRNVHIGTCDYQIAVCRMELRGLQISLSELHKRQERALIQAQVLEHSLRQEAAKDGFPRINLNSPTQLKKWLQIESTNKHTLRKNIASVKCADTILEFRKWEKADSTYFTPYKNFLRGGNILYANYHLTTPGTKSRGPDKRAGTVSGRLSSSKPNLQQLPKDDDIYGVKSIFISRPGFRFVEYDYSQAELRLGAFYGRETGMLEMFFAGVDLHSGVASDMSVDRGIAKNINFSALYNIGAETFAENYLMPVREAEGYLRTFHAKFPGIKRLQRMCERIAKETGMIRLYSGKVCHFNDERFSPTFFANNRLVQSTVSEMIRIAACEIDTKFPDARLVMVTHDSLTFEIPEELVDELDAPIREVMQCQPWANVPMIVDGKSGRSLGDLSKMPRVRAGIPAEVLQKCSDECFA